MQYEFLFKPLECIASQQAGFCKELFDLKQKLPKFSEIVRQFDKEVRAVRSKVFMFSVLIFEEEEEKTMNAFVMFLQTSD